jgi:hypothetical protein
MFTRNEIAFLKRFKKPHPIEPAQQSVIDAHIFSGILKYSGVDEQNGRFIQTAVLTDLGRRRLNKDTIRNNCLLRWLHDFFQMA